jgi:hypothetical protein
MKKCREFSSVEAYQQFYKGFAAWDLSISNSSDPLTAPEHVFWFTMRDSYVFGILEYFGLVANCGDWQCKITDANLHDIPLMGTKTSKTSEDILPGHFYSVASHLHEMRLIQDQEAKRPSLHSILAVASIIGVAGLGVVGLASSLVLRQSRKKDVAQVAKAQTFGHSSEQTVSQVTPSSLRVRVGTPVAAHE